MNHNYCKLCNRKIDPYSYSNKVYCSSFCRDTAYRIRKGQYTLQEGLDRVKGVVNGQ